MHDLAASRPPTILRGRIDDSAGGQRLDAVLAAMFPAHSRSRIAEWIKAGDVRVDGAPRQSPSSKVWGGEAVELSVALTEETDDAPESIPIDIVFEDAHIIVLNKPPGLVVHPGAGNREGTLLNALLHHAPQVANVPRAGIVHRLDKDTSGLMVVAKTIEAHTALVRQLQARTVSREYLALVHGAFILSKVYEGEIGRHPTARTKMAVVTRNGKPARTQVSPERRFEQHTLVRCKLDTGRTHQIRVHLSHAGFPIVGDTVYGKRKSAPSFHRQALHATRLALTHPHSGKALKWDAPLPDDMQALLAEVSADDSKSL